MLDARCSMLDALLVDLGTPRIVPLVSRVGSGQPIRVQTVTDVRCDIELRCSVGALSLQPATALSPLSYGCTRGGRRVGGTHPPMVGTASI